MKKSIITLLVFAVLFISFSPSVSNASVLNDNNNVSNQNHDVISKEKVEKLKEKYNKHQGIDDKTKKDFLSKLDEVQFLEQKKYISDDEKELKLIDKQISTNKYVCKFWD